LNCINVNFCVFVAFVQDDNDVQYLLDNMPISIHKVSHFALLRDVLHNYINVKIFTRRILNTSTVIIIKNFVLIYLWRSKNSNK